MTNSLLSSLTEIFHCFKQLRQLLEQDKSFFSKRDLASIEESNKNKSQLLNHVSQLIESCDLTSSTESTGGFIGAIEIKARDYPFEIKNEIIRIAQALEAEMMVCYENLAINNKIVSSNMQQLKEFWSKITSFANGNASVYDAKANTETR